MNVYQCVMPFRPVGCPNKGSTGVSFKTSLIFIWSSAHLKIKTPCSSRTRKHSLKPSVKSSCQVLLRTPYLALNQDFGPACFKWGGSKTTNLNELSANGRFVKLICVSGAIFKERPSHNTWLSLRKSPKMASGLFLLNHIILLPQHGSSILFIGWLALQTGQLLNKLHCS